MYLDGYKYWLAYKKNKTSYFRCSRYKSMCPGRCVVQDTKVRSSTAHNHPPEPDRVLVDIFRKVLTQRAATENTDLYTIFWEEASQRHSEAALLYPFALAESAMRKARRKQLPQAPKNIDELSDILGNSTLFRIHSGSNKDQFYQKTLTFEDGACVIFIHMKTLTALGHIDEIHLNMALDIPATSTTIPYYLLIIHAARSYYNIPIVYVLLTSQTESCYAAVLAYVRENLSAYVAPNIVMSDYCQQIQSALAYTFPEASIRGYWFHYTNDILAFIKNQGIYGQLLRGHASSALRMLLVLPLLPAEYMTPGLESIRKWSREKQVHTNYLAQITEYIEQSWLRKVGADKMSIFGLSHGVYNHIQHFNRELNGLLNANNPPFWNVLECITHIATRTYVKCNKKLKMAKQKPLSKNQQVLDTIVKNATQLWIRTPVHLRNPLQFLQLTSHCINDINYFNYNNLDDTRVTISANSSITNKFLNYNSTPMAKASHLPAKSTKIAKSINIISSVASDSNAISYVNYNDVSIPSLTLSTNTLTTTIEPNNFQNNIAQFIDSSSIHKVTANATVSSNPPPLAFFPKIAKSRQKPILFSSTEPPPLVPIQYKLKKPN